MVWRRFAKYRNVFSRHTRRVRKNAPFNYFLLGILREPPLINYGLWRWVDTEPRTILLLNGKRSLFTKLDLSKVFWQFPNSSSWNPRLTWCDRTHYYVVFPPCTVSKFLFIVFEWLFWWWENYIKIVLLTINVGYHQSFRHCCHHWWEATQIPIKKRHDVNTTLPRNKYWQGKAVIKQC